MNGGYRSTNIDFIKLDENGAPTTSIGTREGVPQVGTIDPYSTVPAVTLANSAGIETVQYGEDAVKYGSGTMILSGICDGSWTCVSGADFGDRSAKKISVKVRGKGAGAIRVSLDYPNRNTIAYIPVDNPGEEFTEVSADLIAEAIGEHKVFFTFAGEDFEVLEWRFER